MNDNSQHPLILVADNDPNHLARYIRWLTNANSYEVIYAKSVDEIEELLTSHYPDLAVIDVRMKDDHDKEDESGLTIALDVAQTGVPVMVLTSYPEFEFVRRASLRFPHGIFKYVNFVGKNENQATFLKLVKQCIKNDDVFIIHGRNSKSKYMVKSFVQELHFHPRILEDEPNLGDTLIEKLERCSDARYIIALMTGDDIGGLQDKPGEMQPRARQNVIFEIGYFMAKRGRRNLSILIEEDAPEGPIEIFSDIYGIVYIPMREGGNWQAKLVKELNHAGFRVKWP